MPDKCICGNNNFREFTKPGITIDEQGDRQKTILSLGECQECGIVRQLNIPFENESQYSEYYKKDYPPIKKSYTKKNYQHDRELAVRRYNVYHLPNENKLKILDVGSGSGAFVDECRKRGMEAYGCELAKYNYVKNDIHIYHDRLEDIHFPTDHFDLTTCHDVLEHILDPDIFLQEMFRTTKQEGACIIDLPDFYHEAGKHHWKDKEHIWFFTTAQLEKLFKKIGFIVDSIKHPIDGKLVFYLKKPIQQRCKILLPPGIGDSYWSIVKLQSFLERKNIPSPVDAFIVCNRDKQFNGHKRSVPFLEMFPFLNSTGIVFENGTNPHLKKIWKEAYARKGRIVFEDIHGCDYFIAYNGHLRVGRQLEEIDNLACNWYPPMFISLEQERFKQKCIEIYGKYIVFYFPLYGTFQYWTNDFPINNIAEAVNKITAHTGYTPVFAGAAWDAENRKCRELRGMINNLVDLSGKTSVQQLFGLIKGSQGVVGYPSGLPIMAAVLKAKTLMIWSDFYNIDFAWHACPPDIRNETYFVEKTKGLTPDKLAQRAVEILTGHKMKMPVRKPIRKPAQKLNRATSDDWQRALNKMRPVSHSFVSDKKNHNTKVTIACVLKSGGDFTVDYVLRLKNMIARNTTVPYKFVCLTDIEIDPKICKSIKLKHNYDRWWSKIELFRPDITSAGRIVYIDLDTVITGNIDNFLTATSDFIALRPWNKRNQQAGLCASGLMAFKNNGAFSFVYDQFSPENINQYSRGDQEYITKALDRNKQSPIFWQDIVPGIYSYKRHCREQRLPKDARIVCFHGRPRPHTVNDPWVMANWR